MRMLSSCMRQLSQMVNWMKNYALMTIQSVQVLFTWYSSIIIMTWQEFYHRLSLNLLLPIWSHCAIRCLLAWCISRRYFTVTSRALISLSIIAVNSNLLILVLHNSTKSKGKQITQIVWSPFGTVHQNWCNCLWAWDGYVECRVSFLMVFQFSFTDKWLYTFRCIMLELFTKKSVFQGNDEIHQLDVIHKILSTPAVEWWPTLADLPRYELTRPHNELPNCFHDLFQK